MSGSVGSPKSRWMSSRFAVLNWPQCWDPPEAGVQTSGGGVVDQVLRAGQVFQSGNLHRARRAITLHPESRSRGTGEPQGHVAQECLPPQLLVDLVGDERIDERGQPAVHRIEEDLRRLDVDLAAPVQVVLAVHHGVAAGAELRVALHQAEDLVGDHLPGEEPGGPRDGSGSSGSRSLFLILSMCSPSLSSSANASMSSLIASRTRASAPRKARRPNPPTTATAATPPVTSAP